MPDSIIVYNNPAQKAFWELIMNNPVEFISTFLITVTVLFVIIVGYFKLKDFIRRRKM